MSAPSRDQDSGFVLVGVVMFVLALTTLGISLFALSSYESQFMQRSLDSEQAFNLASSGLARASYRLAAKGILGDVKALQGSDGITYAVATQLKSGIQDSVGTVVYGGSDIRIRIGTSVNGNPRMLEAWFLPQASSANLYKRLMALSDPDTGLTVTIYDYDDNIPGLDFNHPRWITTRLAGSVWQNAPFEAPSECDSAAQLPSFEASGGVPEPSLATYFASHWATATPVLKSAGPTFTLDASGSPDQVRYFKTVAPDPDDSNWSLKFGFPDPAAVVNVNGTAIWMFDRGLFSLKQLTVQGPSSALLVLVARTSLDVNEEKGSGLSFISALRSLGPGVVLISDGRVGLETDFQKSAESSVGFLTIFAKRALIMGPEDPGTGPELILSHPSGHPLDTRLDELWTKGYLPNATSMPGGTMAMRPGSWRQYPN